MTAGPRPASLPGWRHEFSGKVRDVYAADDGRTDVVLLLATDRVSAYDHVLQTPIPGKGEVLTAISHWWFERLGDVVANHLVDPSDAPPVPAGLVPRATVARRLAMVPVECVARGYLAGSAWQEYRDRGTVAGMALPDGLAEASLLPSPLFTPATKAPSGQHDENITYEQLVDMVGEEVAGDLREATLAVYARGAQVAEGAGLLLADTKLEFGTAPDGTLVLADEVLTPDSSRYWSAADWQPGHPPPMFDKQIVRDWLTGPESGWSTASTQPPPPLPPEVVARTADRYREVLARLTGRTA